MVYSSIGQLTEIWDNLQPTANKVLVTWDNTTNGNVSTVTDANGKRRLLFAYANGLMTSVAFQTNTSGTWTTQHTTSYAYDNGATRDATSGWFVPANATEWTSLLAGTGISNPANLWLMQESSGNLADSIASMTLTAFNAPSYNNVVFGWSRKAVGVSNSVDDFFGTGVNLSTTSGMLLGLVKFTPPAGPAQIFSLGHFSDSQRRVKVTSMPVYEAAGDGGQATLDGSSNPSGTVHPVLLRLNRSAAYFKVTTDQETITPAYTAPWGTGSSIDIGTNSFGTATVRYLYSALWAGTNAELTDAQVSTLISRIKTGNLTSVTIGGQLAQQYTYNVANSLSQITDGASNQIVAFTYDSATTGKVVRVDTSRGTVGFEYSSTRTTCTGKTALYFNKGSSTSCSVDADCGSGFLCGGNTGAGSTGTCFLAGRCMTTATMNGESVVTNVDPLGAGGGSCTGACTDVAQYAWLDPASGGQSLNVTGRKDALANWTSAQYNANGLPTQIGYGDNDGNVTNGGYARTVYLFYDSAYPGRIAEVRRKSDLDPNAASCSASVTTGCTRTIYSYYADTKQLHTVEQAGTTLDSTGATATYSNVITYVHDAKARVTEIDGAVSGIKTTFDYYIKADPNLDGFLADYKMYKDGTNFLQPNVIAYDFWGHPTGVQAPDGNITCDTYDSARGFLSQRRKAMNGQLDCSTTNAADITTSWACDSWLRLTQLTRPDGSCMFYAYDTTGRLSTTKRRDDCLTSSTGDSQTYSYTPDSQVSEVDTYDASNTLTAKQPYTYFNSRRLQNIVNPVDVTKFTGCRSAHVTPPPGTPAARQV